MVDHTHPQVPVRGRTVGIQLRHPVHMKVVSQEGNRKMATSRRKCLERWNGTASSVGTAGGAVVPRCQKHI